MKPSDALMFMMVVGAMAGSSGYSFQNMEDFVDIPLPEYAEKKTYGSSEETTKDD